MTTDQPKPSEQKPSEVLRPLYDALCDEQSWASPRVVASSREHVEKLYDYLDSNHAQLSDLAGVVRVLAKTVTHREPVDVHRLEAWLSGEQHRQQRLVDLDLATKPREEWKPDFVTPWIAVPPAKPEPREEAPDTLSDQQKKDLATSIRAALSEPSPTGDEAGEWAEKWITSMVSCDNPHIMFGSQGFKVKREEVVPTVKYARARYAEQLTAYAAHRTREIQAALSAANRRVGELESRTIEEQAHAWERIHGSLTVLHGGIGWINAGEKPVDAVCRIVTASASKDAEIKRLSDMVERLKFLVPANIKWDKEPRP